MSGKSLQQLTTAELRSECTARGISMSGSKPDIIIRLEGHIRERGQDPANVRFYPVQPSINILADGTGEQPDASTTLVDTNVSQVFEQSSGGISTSPTASQIPTDNLSEYCGYQSTMRQGQSIQPIESDIFKTAAEQLKLLKQTLPQTNDTKSFEARLRALETSMTNFFTETRLAAAQQPHNNTVPRINIHPSPAHVTNRTHDNYQSGRSYEYNDGDAQYSANHIAAANNRPFFTREPHNNYTGHTTHTSQFTPYDARTHERSVLIPYEDLRTARASLPEFTGTRAEDPVRFIENTEAILVQARIHPAGWCRAVEPQLKGTASTWYNSIRPLDLSWTEFRDEFYENFNNAEIQSRLRADIVSTRQTPKQSLTEFVLNKNQLARRVTTGLSEPELVGIIAGLARDTFRTHLRLHRPQTFSELRRIAGVLDPATDSTSPPTQRWTPKPKKGPDTPQTAPPVKKKYFGNSFDDQPPGPCKFCGELHWHSRCPHRPSRPGNGGGVDGD
uniref:Activity-regulated cytoskeleton-associated protein n=1 Tax=Schizaphis graminum TaxID=13262 RepID=A0A2S2PI82_SCHGA